MKANSTNFYIEFVQHAMVANTEFEFRTALQSFVREIFQAQAHFINLALHRFTNGRRQTIK